MLDLDNFISKFQFMVFVSDNIFLSLDWHQSVFGINEN